MAVFVGDFIDRGSEQAKTIEIVRAMVQMGSAKAVMGNHEFNAIAWYTLSPDEPGEYLRPRYRGEKNRRQHEKFLAEVEHDAALHGEIIEWFKTLPVWLDLPGIRVVHACWHQDFMDWLGPQLAAEPRLPAELLVPSTREPSDPGEKDNATPSVFKAVEAITKGLEVPLPKGLTIRDKDGHERDRVRTRWWDSDASTYERAAMVSDFERDGLPDHALPSHARISVPTDKPIFFGHYWLEGAPAILASHIACVDYSAGNGGALVAYRWHGESALTPKNFTWAE